MPGITGDQMDTLNAIAIQMFEMPFDQLPLEAKKDVLEAARPEERAGGGMMNINRMTAPLGYYRGGTASDKALEKRGFGEKEMNFASILQDMEGSEGAKEPIGLRKLEAELFPVDPMIQMKDNLMDELRGIKDKGLEGIRSLVEETIGAGPAEGSGSLMGSLDPLVRGLMIYDILSDKIGKRPPISVIMDVDGYDDDQLIEAHKEYGGDRFK
jgi:hypothetical protein